MQMLADTERARDALAQRVSDATGAINIAFFGALVRGASSCCCRRRARKEGVAGCPQ